MIYSAMVNKAIKVMFEAHKDQRDKSGLPYVFHPFHLAEQMKDEVTTAAALLHDIIEDTDMTADGLRELGFPEKVVRIVELLTHKDGESYEDYIERIKTDPGARAVKLADLRHNSDMTRLETVTQRDIDRAEKYRRAIKVLSGEDAENGNRGSEILEAISRRRSYRGKYNSEAVPRDDLRKIMQAGLDAPSGCNKQTVSLIAVDDSEILARLKAVIDPPVAETAPAAICVLTNRETAYRDKCFAVQDYAAAIENMLLAIEALGYRSCWYEGHITDDDDIAGKMAKILEVPEGYELVCFLPVGIAEEETVMPKKKEFGERVLPQTAAGACPCTQLRRK